MAFRLGHIRTAFKKLCRQTGRNGGRARVPIGVCAGERGELKGGRVRANQDGQGVLELGAAFGQRGGFGFRGCQFGFRSRDVQLVADAALETAADELDLLVAQAHGAGHSGDLSIERAEQEIVLRDVSLEGEQDVVVGGEGGRGLGAGALEAAADPSPQINLVAQVERGAEGVGRQRPEAGDLVRGNALAREARIEIQVGQELAARHPGSRAGLVHARDRSLEFLVGFQRP